MQKYLSSYVPDYAQGRFNASNRGVPDVAANGWNITVVDDGHFELFYGTSASAPIFSSMITAVNDARLAAGKGPVGFINPAVSASRSVGLVAGG